MAWTASAYLAACDESARAAEIARAEDARCFSEADDMTDIIFVVDDKEIHFNTAVLSISSPVFKAMFTSDFREKEAKKIPLPGKRHEDMVAFFKQLHPMYCKRTPITGHLLKKILPLADEYQAKSVLDACEDYIGEDLLKGAQPRMLTDYLLLCEQHTLKKHRAQMITSCVQVDSLALETTPSYKELPQELKWDILLQRCRNVENYVEQKVKPLVDKLRRVKEGVVCTSCSSSQYKDYLCEKCFKSKIPGVIGKLEPFP